MKKNWNKILKVNLLKSDKYKWGLFPIKRIEQSFSTEDDSELSDIKKFIKEEIKNINSQIKHYKKWSPRVYHPNTYKSLEIEKRTFEIILKRLSKK
jgi:hypothetical protein